MNWSPDTLLHQALGDVWIEMFVRDWTANHNNPMSNRLVSNMGVRLKTLRKSFDCSGTEKLTLARAQDMLFWLSIHSSAGGRVHVGVADLVTPGIF